MLSKQIVCIDPGHGGYDPGAMASGAREKDITLQIGLQLRDLLQRAGLRVVMTREADQSPGGYTEVNADLGERCRIANDAGVDTFLSIHVNAGGGKGAEIYVNGDGGRIAGLASGIIKNVSSICGTHGQAVRDGGPRGAGWAVIRNTVADAMLVEIGFIDSDDLPKIQAHLHEFAPLIAQAFCDFYGVPFSGQSQPVLDKDGANLVISQLGALTKTVTPDVLVACNYAANALRRAISAQVNEELGAPNAQAAATLIDVLGALWKSTDRRGIQDAYHLAADTLRRV